MSLQPKQLTTEKPHISRIAVGILVGIFLFTIFMVGYDQGQILSIVQGKEAYDGMWMHEFYHDMRHAAGFPCH